MFETEKITPSEPARPAAPGVTDSVNTITGSVAPGDGADKPVDVSRAGDPIPKDEPQSSPSDAASPNDEDKIPPASLVLVMTALCLATFLAALDISIITTVIPTIAEHFRSTSGYVWVGSCYTLGCTVSSPVWSKFSDIFGRKPILLAANAVFFLGSLLCAIATSFGMLLVGRVIQGLGGGGLLVLPLICISDLVSMRKRGTYYAMFGGVWAVAGSIGPVIGGLFAQKVSWRWCFYINLPIDGLAFFILMFFLTVHNPRTPIWDGLKAVDWLGSISLVGGTLMFLLGLEFGGVTFAWDSAATICLILFGVLCCVLFVLIERYVAPFPLIPTRIVNTISNAAILVGVWMHGMILVAASYFIPLYFQVVLGAGPILSGVWMLPQAIAIAVSSIFSGIYIRKTGNYLVLIWVSFAITVLGTGLFINFDTERNFAKIILYQIVIGLGIGPLFQGSLISLQAAVATADIAAATATVLLTRNLATSVSIVIAGVMIQNFLVNRHGDAIFSALGPQRSQQVLGGNMGANTAFVQNLPPSERFLVRDSIRDAMSYMWIAFTAFTAIGLISSFFIRHRDLSKTHTETKTGLDHLAARNKKGSGSHLGNLSDPGMTVDGGSKNDLEGGSKTVPVAPNTVVDPAAETTPALSSGVQGMPAPQFEAKP